MTRPAALRVLIADDEPLARRRLARMLGRIGDVVVLGEAGDVAEAARAVARLRPDLLLLDIQMPGGDGFAVIDRLGAACPPVIFVTAFDQYALRAFDAAAVDYLTKPVELPRLVAAIDRARAQAAQRDRDDRIAELQALVQTLRASMRDDPGAPHDLWVKSRDGHRRIAIDRIHHITAERDYVRLHSDGQSYLLAESMTAIAQRLEPLGFLRIHRSVIVHRGAIAGLNRTRYGALVVSLSDGSALPVGRSYLPRLRAALGL